MFLVLGVESMGSRFVRIRTPHGGSGLLSAAMRRAALNRNALLSGLCGPQSTDGDKIHRYDIGGLSFEKNRAFERSPPVIARYFQIFRRLKIFPRRYFAL